MIEKKIIKKSDGVDYIKDFLNLINLPNVSMKDVIESKKPCVFIRHDVDHDLNCAIEIAEVEAQNNYVSTFFLLPPGSYGEERNYYGIIEDGKIIHDPTLIDKCKYIIELGHDIGFHNDVVAMALKTCQDPAELIKREVDFFDKHSIPLIGTAAHGSPLARQLEFNNREIFEECIRKGRETGRTIEYNDWRVKLHSLKLSDFGFQYEAYSLPRDSRISESGAKWGGKIVGQQIDRERLKENFDINEFRMIMSRLKPDIEVEVMQVMTHPCHWKVVL